MPDREFAASCLILTCALGLAACKFACNTCASPSFMPPRLTGKISISIILSYEYPAEISYNC